MLDVAFRVPVDVLVDSNVRVPPGDTVSVGLFVASDATENTLRIMMLHVSMFISPVMVTLPSQVKVLVPSASVLIPSAASVFVSR